MTPQTQITIGSTAGGYNLLNLLNGTTTGSGHQAAQTWANLRSACALLSLQCDPASPHAVYIGGSSISTSNYGLFLNPGDARQIGPLMVNNIDMQEIWLLGVGAGTLVNVTVVYN